MRPNNLSMAAMPKVPFDLVPTGRPNEWAITMHIPGYADGTLSAVAERSGKGVLGIVDRAGRLVDHVVVPGGAKDGTVRATYRNGVLDAAFELVRPMPAS